MSKSQKLHHLITNLEQNGDEEIKEEMAGGGSRGQAWFCTTGLASDIVIEVGDMAFHLHKFPLMSKSQKLHHLITDLEQNGDEEIKDEMAGGGSRGHAWFCTTGLASDIVVEVGDMAFHLHKSPLMSKSQKLHHLITDLEQNGDDRREDDVSSSDDDRTHHHIVLPGFPGGPEIFEAAAMFCYGVRLDLTPWNTAPLRCAAEYLKMTDDDNLASRVDLFFSHSVLSNLTDSIQTLKSCEHLMPLADHLGIVQRCLDSIAALSRSAPLLFSWPLAN